jgi:hypothetical protein
MYDIKNCFICRPSDSPVAEDVGIEPRTVATIWLWLSDALTTRLGLIHRGAKASRQRKTPHFQYLTLCVMQLTELDSGRIFGAGG